MNVVSLTQKLLSYPSVTPHQAGCLDFIEVYLTQAGFVCHRFPAHGVDNLYARWGTNHPNFCFSGHVDVVPTGPLSDWIFPPFDGVIHDGLLYGRGVVDMKGAISAFMMATSTVLSTLSPATTQGSVSFLLTSDEEGPALYGTRYVLAELKRLGEILDMALVGEPTNITHIGDTVKVGRRGSLNLTLTEKGTSGHAAYPHLADNPIPRFLRCLSHMADFSLDQGTPLFDPSMLQVVSVETENKAYNVIPSTITARLNCRFNSLHTGQSLIDWAHTQAKLFLHNYKLESHISGESFYCEDDFLKTLLKTSIHKITGISPTLSTSGGTSDARFIKDVCPVIEFGLIHKTAHHKDEHIALSDLILLEKIYTDILKSILRRF